MGINSYVMIASTASQFNFDVWAVYLFEDDDGIIDISEIYGRQYRRRRHVAYIASMSFLMLLVGLLPMLQAQVVPWFELVVTPLAPYQASYFTS